MRSPVVRDAAIVLLFTTSMLMVAMGHQAFLEGCVCLVNSILRAVVALGVGVALLGVDTLLKPDHVRAVRALDMLRSLALLAGGFFLVQHAFFILEAA